MTWTFTRPTTPCGAVAVTFVDETKVTLDAGVVPKLTLAPFKPLNPVPVMVTRVPPAVGPCPGETAVMRGAAVAADAAGIGSAVAIRIGVVSAARHAARRNMCGSSRGKTPCMITSPFATYVSTFVSTRT
jgi:hypothetical protein